MFGIVLITVATMLWGISGGIADFLIGKGWDPQIVAFYRGFIGLLCFFFWYILHPKTGAGSMSVAGITAGLVAGLSYALFIFGFKYATNNGRPQFILLIAFFTLSLLLFIFSDHKDISAVIFQMIYIGLFF